MRRVDSWRKAGLDQGTTGTSRRFRRHGRAGGRAGQAATAPTTTGQAAASGAFLSTVTRRMALRIWGAMMNWLKGYGQPQPLPPIIIRHQAAAEASQDRALAQVWLTGQSRRLVMIVCCPVCGSPGTAHDNGYSDSYRRWVCTSLTCKNAWKEKADLNTESVRTVV